MERAWARSAATGSLPCDVQKALNQPSECKVGLIRITNQLSDLPDRAVHVQYILLASTRLTGQRQHGRVLHDPGDQTADS